MNEANLFKFFLPLLSLLCADKDGSGTIDLEELKILFKELQVNFTDEEVKSFHEASDMDSSKGIDFKEFIVLLSLLYFLGQPGGGGSSVSSPYC